MRIHQLSPQIANQIAAGEVIERPASVVKELLENSLDAGADTISIEISYGGLNQIKISDNGIGIVADDLPLAIAAHATSKINTLNDLYAIDSMGFRGEALASIASVAKVSISSKPAIQDTAMMLRVQGIETTISPCARTVGTSIDVVDLFFNAPVRKRFLKSEKLEFQAIETVVKRFALGAPQIALTLKHNGKQILSLPAATSEQAQLIRLRRLLGNAFVKEVIYLDVERAGMRLYGWTSGINYQRSQNDRQWVYINQRMVKDKLLNHAVKQAYENWLYPGRFPVCVLYFTINPAEVDVNVHPTKHEVRFQQPRLVHDFFTSQLIAALQSVQTNNEVQTYELASHLREHYQEAIYEPYPKLVPPSVQSKSESEVEVPWIILNNHYILVLVQQQPYIVDIFAIQKYLLQEQLGQQSLPLPNRPLLVPIRYPLTEKLKNEVGKLSENLNQLGIQFELSGEYEVLIRTIPRDVPYLNLHLFFNALAQIETFQMDDLLELICQTQIFDPKLLDAEEKMKLNQFLKQSHGQNHKQPGLFKALTVEDCRNLLYV
ncbi:DNA mismatch repair endonuclease MutL [Legionella sp.]|uniref:DNA mismatch repair endonuclease MutL n=1 Tax=Legionella sp. TaxID=459 RepID=UPI003CC60366